MRFATGRGTPQSDLDFTPSEHQFAQAADDQFGVIGNEVIETELTIQRQR
jgi:hypothetical protein